MKITISKPALRAWVPLTKMTTLILILAVRVGAQNPGARDQGRSMTISTRGIAATSQTLASQAGAEMLAQGGSAVDAAIAANAVLAVTEPMMNGIGGDLFAMVWTAKDGKLQGLNASGWAPKDLNIDFLKEKGLKIMPARGIHAVTVPGAVGGWAALHKRYGKLPWKDLFQPAIAYARDGFPVTERIAASWEGTAALYAKPEAAPHIFLPGGKPPAVGEIFRNPDLAKAFALVAAQGPDAVYKGAIAQAILKTSHQQGGRLQASDLAEWAPEWVAPISTVYRGWTVYELPPNGSGIGALEMLNTMEAREMSTWPANGAESLHWRIEAMHLAWADLWRYVSDPRFVPIPVKPLLSKEYARQRAAAIDLAHANCAAAAGEELTTSSNTTYLAVVDKEGNIASWIQSLASGGGSGVNVEGMGFHLQNRGARFRLDPAHANALAPRKRPFHTIIPAFMEKGASKIGFGIMGGPTQPYSHGQFVSNIADYGMNIQAAMDAPRFAPANSRNDCAVNMESRVNPEVQEVLRQRGHIVKPLGAFNTSGVGVGQAVMRDAASGVNYGASDARGDGSAIPHGLAVGKTPH